MLTLDQFKQALPEQMAPSVSQELIDTINSTLKDQEAMEIFKENLLSYTHVLQQGKFTLINYINAVKYVGFKVMGLTNKEAYMRTFPDKYPQFVANGVSEKDIASYITAYNKSKLVNLIYAQTQIPTHILNAPFFQKAINVQADLMMNAKSEMVRFNAANSLLTHLKPPEAAKIELDISVNRSNIIDDYEKVMRQMVEKQKELIAAGGDVKQIANASIKPFAEEIIDITPEPVTATVPVTKEKSIFA